MVCTAWSGISSRSLRAKACLSWAGTISLKRESGIISSVRYHKCLFSAFTALAEIPALMSLYSKRRLYMLRSFQGASTATWHVNHHLLLTVVAKMTKSRIFGKWCFVVTVPCRSCSIWSCMRAILILYSNLDIHLALWKAPGCLNVMDCWQPRKNIHNSRNSR